MIDWEGMTPDQMADRIELEAKASDNEDDREYGLIVASCIRKDKRRKETAK